MRFFCPLRQILMRPVCTERHTTQRFLERERERERVCAIDAELTHGRVKITVRQTTIFCRAGGQLRFSHTTMDLTPDRPGAYMAPNYLFPCMGGQCFTERLDVSQPALTRSCMKNPQACADAVTRGLLSPLTPMINGTSESVLPVDQPVRI